MVVATLVRLRLVSGLQLGLKLVWGVVAGLDLVLRLDAAAETLAKLDVEFLRSHVWLRDREVASPSHESLGVPEAIIVSLSEDDVHLLQTSTSTFREEAVRAKGRMIDQQHVKKTQWTANSKIIEDLPVDDRDEGQVQDRKDDVGLVRDVGECRWSDHDDEEVEEPVGGGGNG